VLVERRYAAAIVFAVTLHAFHFPRSCFPLTHPVCAAVRRAFSPLCCGSSNYPRRLVSCKLGCPPQQGTETPLQTRRSAAENARTVRFGFHFEDLDMSVFLRARVRCRNLPSVAQRLVPAVPAVLSVAVPTCQHATQQ